MTDKAHIAQAAINAALGGGPAAYLAFSGGRESVVLAHMCQHLPVTLVWVNTGAMFPHMVKWVRQFGEGRSLIEISSDQKANWAAMGLPADVLPVANAMPGEMHQEPRLQAWVSCCSSLRAQPIANALAAAGVPCVLIHGQRLDDRAPGLGLSGAKGMLPGGSDVLAPLADWEDSDVADYIDRHQLSLPPQYPKHADSLECWNCPAAFHGAKGAERIAYMSERHPELLRQVAPTVNLIASAVRGALHRSDQVLETARASAPSVPTGRIVAQRTMGMGDCGLAALATVIERDYEATANLMGYQIDERGWPLLPAGGGLANVEMASALLAIGYSGTLITVSDHPANQGQAGFTRSPRQTELAELLRGERAILMVTDWFNGRPAMHAMPWIDDVAYDCRQPITAVQFDQLSVAAAMIIRPTVRFAA